jgi:hypothetical protein
MYPLLSRLRTRRRSAILAVLLGVVLRGLIPSGFMPSHSDGGLTITVCSGATSYSVEVPTGGQDDGGTKFPVSQACVFGVLMPQDALLPTDSGVRAPTPETRLLASNSAGAAARVALLSAPPPPARGPPSQA